MGCRQVGLRSKGWAVDHQPGRRVDGYSHHDHQKGDLQVSRKRVNGSQRGFVAGKGRGIKEGVVKGGVLWGYLYLYVHCTYVNSH
jgi:hypothetical protein